MTLPSVGGAWTCQDGESGYGADGETSGYCLTSGGATNFRPIGRFSGYHLTDFVGALAGIFLEDALPETAPLALRFYVSDSSEGGTETDFLTLTPQIGQVFFIGDGLTGTGTGAIQTFHVPPRPPTFIWVPWITAGRQITPCRGATPTTWGRSM